MTFGNPTLNPPVDERRDHIIGPDDAPVTLVEYGDYECPYCGAAHLIVKQILRALGDDVRYVFRHFPLTRVHPHAQQAAEAAEAAGVQGFARDLDSGAHTPRVREDFMSGVRSGVNGTPTFFINGRRHDGGYDPQTLLAAIAATAARTPTSAGGRR